VDLFRVFDWDGSSRGRADGGPLFVARARQGAGRHDNPADYGAWYCSRAAAAAVAECIQSLRGHVLQDSDFTRRQGRTKALVALRLNDRAAVVDLDDPSELVSRRLRPSQVAMLQRRVTQAIAASLFREGVGGLSWWSTLNSDWTNVTLFHERALPLVDVAEAPRALSTQLAEVREAAERIGITI
jgi:hypothetical protein